MTKEAVVTDDQFLKDLRTVRKPKKELSPDQIQELRDLFCSKRLDMNELHEIERSSGKLFKKGRFSNAEKAIIRASLKEFCQEKGVTEQEFVESYFTVKRKGGEQCTDKRFKKLFKRITNKLDGRPISLVYHCIRRMYHPGNLKGRWSEADDQELKRLFVIHGPDWETIGISMGRYGMNARDRYKRFRKSGSSGPWTAGEVERLTSAVSYVRTVSTTSCWDFISERVETRSAIQCMYKWILLESTIKNNGIRPKWTPELDFYLVGRIYDLAVEDETEVIWKELVDEGWQVYLNSFRLQLRFSVLKKRVRNYKNITFDELLESLLLSLRPLVPNLVDNECMADN